MSDLNYVIGNYGQTVATASYPTIVQSATITTSGFPVQITVTGDGEPSGSGWQRLQIFRGATSVGEVLQVSSSGSGNNVSVNMMHIDTPVAGTYTYSVKVINGSGIGVTYSELGQLSMIVEEKIVSSYFSNNWLRRDISAPDTYYGYSPDYTTSDSDGNWSIKKVSVSGTVESVTWANGNPKSTVSIWDDRINCFIAPTSSIGLTGSSISSNGNTVIKLDWTMLAGVESYKILVSDSETGVAFTDGGYILYNNGYNSAVTYEVFNNNSYTYKNPEVGKSYDVEIVASNVAGSVTQSITILTYNMPTNVTPPVISGATSIGQTLTSTDGVWTGDVNIGYTITYTYQWYRGLTAIGGATSNTYTLISIDAGETIKCVVTANTTLYGSASANSNSLILTSPSNTKYILNALSTRIGIDLTSDRCLTGYLNQLTNNYIYIYSNISTQLKLRLEADDIFISDMDCINTYLKNNITNE